MTLQTAKLDQLRHIPGRKGLPYIGIALDFIKDPYAESLSCYNKYGPVFRQYILGEWSVSLAGADAVEYVLTDPDRIFSSKKGWRLLKDVFPGGLMLRDFDDHRAHRRVMQPTFRAAAMEDYLTRMNGGIADLIADWDLDGTLKFYPAIKGLTLQLGAAVFMGLPIGSTDADALNTAFQDEVAASLALVRAPIPGTTYKRGLDGRAFLARRFGEMIPERRAQPGPDFFSQMVTATDGDGKGWSEEQIIDHLNFLMMAAHDTTTSALTTMVWALARWPDWQDAIRAELADLPDGRLAMGDLARMEVTERVFKEALRLMPPVPFIPRRAEKAFEWEGVTIPAGANVGVSPGMTMMQEEYWTEPEKFDPDRFSSNRAEDRNHRFAWAPFGGGAHKCIGLHFAMMQVKAFTAQFLRRYHVALVDAEGTQWQRVPIPKPTNGLPIRLTRL